VETADGLLTPEAVDAAIRPESRYFARTSVVCLENTHNGAGGQVMDAARTRAVADAARARGASVHLDGARLPNAAAASGRSMAELAAPADTVMVSLSKGLGAPIGALLAGTAEAMERGWRLRRRLGGAMRQSGILAAAGLHALRHHRDRLPDDHARARRLASAASSVEGLSVSSPETNIVLLDLGDPGLQVAPLLAALERRGVLMASFGARRVRAVTHLDVDDRGIERAAEALAAAVAELRR
jgi:threonine aldolase